MKETATHIYFWGTYLSNWHKCVFKDDQFLYPSSEAYLMTQKALLFGDIESATKIIKTREPRKQKALGRLVKGFNDTVWNQHKFEIMVKGLFLKFSQNKSLKNQLLATGSKTLVEGSPYDKIWGVGLKWDDPRILDEANWKGENRLGQALMIIREMMIFEDSKHRL